MTTPLYWLTLTAALTLLMWIPYILNAVVVRGLMDAMANPSEKDKPLAPWAARAKRAHANSVENIGIFAALILVAHLVQVSGEGVGSAAMIYFFSRLAHYFIYTFGIPVVRTLSFAVGFGAQLFIAVAILQQASS